MGDAGPLCVAPRVAWRLSLCCIQTPSPVHFFIKKAPINAACASDKFQTADRYRAFWESGHVPLDALLWPECQAGSRWRVAPRRYHKSTSCSGATRQMCSSTSLFYNRNPFWLEMVLCPKTSHLPLSDFIYILKFKWYDNNKVKITWINTFQK